jgi:prolipoprotein diacylglyceryltransferase
MKPHLHIKIFNFQIKSFHFFGVLGYLLGTILGVIIATQIVMKPGIVLLMAAVGAATFFLLVYISKWVAGEEIIVYYHHEISILLFCTLTLYLLKLPVLPYLDITILGIGVFIVLGRVGCYSVGCCHGRPHKHGVKYGQKHVDAGFTWFYKDVPLLPVQLIESAYVLCIVITGVVLLLNNVAPGTVLIVYTVIYGAMRFTLEFFRGDPDRPLWVGLSEAQWTSLGLTAITFGFSQAGWLPVYNWHTFILIAMLVAALVAMYFFNRNPEQKLFSAPHIRQLAEGINILDKVNNNIQTGQPQKINVYTTRAGFSLSCGTRNINSEKQQHYTFSLKNKRIINRQAAGKMAEIISTLTKHQEKYELVEKQNGIYHILFNETEPTGNIQK